jgi:tetratricopeptide (TPR) repeat protein
VEDLADVLAYHYLQALELSRASGTSEGTQELEDAARQYLGLAGVRALALDVAAAEASLSRALALTPPGRPERAGLLERWAHAAQQQGRLKETKAALEEAFTLEHEAGRPVAAGRILVATMTVLWALGDPRRLDVIAQALALLETQPPGPELVAARGELAGAHMISSDYPAAIEEADRALELSAGLGLPEPARALGFRGIARCFLGDVRGFADMQRALELSLQQGDSRGAAVLLANQTLARAHFEGPHAAVAQSRQAQAFCEQRGIAEGLLMMASEEVSFLAESGQVAQALSEAGSVIEQAEERGNLPSLIQARSLQVRFRVRRDEVPQEPGLAEQLAAASRGTGIPQLTVIGFAGAAELLLAQGRPAEARSLLVELTDIDALRTDPDCGAHLPELVRCALSLGDTVLAGRLADGVEAGTPLVERSLSSVRAALAEADDPGVAAALFADVAARWQEFGQLPEQAYALLGEGRCRLAAGLPDAAEPLSRAKELFITMGLRQAVADTDALLGRPATGSQAP